MSDDTVAAIMACPSMSYHEKIPHTRATLDLLHPNFIFFILWIVFTYYNSIRNQGVPQQSRYHITEYP